MIAQLIFNSSQWVRPILIGAGACLTAIPAAAQIVPDETLGNERSRLDSNRPLRDQLVDRIEGVPFGVQICSTVFKNSTCEKGSEFILPIPSALKIFSVESQAPIHPGFWAHWAWMGLPTYFC